MNYMDTLELKIKNWQTVTQAQKMFQDYINILDNDVNLLKKARIQDKQYPFKELIDEYHPLLQFAELYCDNNCVEIRYTGHDTQTKDLKYDGEIRMPNGTILTIEIAKPFDGYKYHKDAEQLNKRGYSDIEVSDGFEFANSIVDQILETAVKKAANNYTDSILVICPPDMNRFRNFIDVLHQIIHDKVISSMKKITFSAKEVYILLPRYSSSDGEYGGELIKIK